MSRLASISLDRRSRSRHNLSFQFVCSFHLSTSSEIRKHRNFHAYALVGRAVWIQCSLDHSARPG